MDKCIAERNSKANLAKKMVTLAALFWGTGGDRLLISLFKRAGNIN
jgi:hypothetical protein